MSDKRKHARSNLLYYLKIYDAATDQCTGHLVDISLGGLKMIGESEISTGKTHQFNISIPEDHVHKSFAVMAKSCWSKTDINPDYFASGFSFTGLSPEDTKFIKMLIKRYELGGGSSND